MSIHRIGSDLIRPSEAEPPKRGGKGSSTESKAPGRRADRVEISAEGRELAAQATEESTGASEARLETIRERMAQGFYDDPDVAEKVAERLLTTGDLSDPV